MNNAFLRATRYAKGLLIPLALQFSLFIGPLHAAVTWDGDDGVSNQIFQAHCTMCHSATPATGKTSQTPYWTSYTTTKDNLSTSAGIIFRINHTSSPMPPTAENDPLTAEEISLVEQWDTDSAPENEAPTITTGSATTDTATASITLNASVFANGLATTFLFQWIEGDGSLDWNAVTPTTTNPVSTSSTGGGTTSESVSDDIAVPKCNTTYQYRSQATNSTGASPYGNTQIKFIDDCATLDADGDGWINTGDNCPTEPNPGQEDLDSDGDGDVCDTDMDGDGVDNKAEDAIRNSDGSVTMDPRDPTDAGLATQDFDADGQTNIEEFDSCTNLGVTPCDAINNGLIPPVINLQNNITVTATGYLTAVDLGVTTSGVGTVELVPVPDTQGPFRPGLHEIVWTATDEQNFASMETQTVEVRPLVRLGGSQITGEGRTISVPVTLNGAAPPCPITTCTVFIQYTVGGTADDTDHNLVDGTIELTDVLGITTALLDIDIAADTSPEPDEQIEITLTGIGIGGNADLSDDVSYTVVITERNIEPEVSIDVIQAVNPVDPNDTTKGPYVYADQNPGTVTVTAKAIDPNDDDLTFDWSSTDAALGAPAVNNPSFAIAPATLTTLTPGNYKIAVLVSDGVNQVADTTTLVVATNAPVLSATQDTDGDGANDAAEGRSDTDGDGLPDYVDPIDDSTLLNSRVLGAGDNNFSRVMVTNAGLSLALGDTAIGAQAPAAQPMKVGARLFASDVKDASDNVVAAPGFTIVSGVYDFKIRGLSDAQRTGQVVIPLTQSIPEQATFLKFSRGAWSAFVETATDGIRSASSDASSKQCPPPGDSSYTTGLTAFDDCLELTLTDGGPNDADGEANGVIKDPGAVVVPASTPTTSPDANSSPGGAGALDWWWLMMLTPLLWLQYRSRQGQAND